MFEGLRGGAAHRTEGGEFAVEPGGVGSEVALTRSHLMDAARKELGEAHERVVSQGWGEGIAWGRRGKSGPLAEQDGSRLFFHRRVRVAGRVRGRYGQGGDQVWVEER